MKVKKKYEKGGKTEKKVMTDAEARKAYKEEMANKSKKTGKFEYGGKVKKAGYGMRLKKKK
jgi:hypothetical protein